MYVFYQVYLFSLLSLHPAFKVASSNYFKFPLVPPDHLPSKLLKVSLDPRRPITIQIRRLKVTFKMTTGHWPLGEASGDRVHGGSALGPQNHKA